jgi:hypothetical protein
VIQDLDLDHDRVGLHMDARLQRLRDAVERREGLQTGRSAAGS